MHVRITNLGFTGAVAVAGTYCLDPVAASANQKWLLFILE